MQMRDNTESYHVAPRLHVNPSPCSCPSAFLSLRFIPRCIRTINCVCFLSPTSSLICLLLSPPSSALGGSCAGDGSVPMVQAGCGVPGGPHDSYWCSGVQLLSHRDPGATHTCIRGYRQTQKLDAHACLHSVVIHMHTQKSVFFLMLPRRCILTKEKRRGRCYAYGSHEQQLSVWQREKKGCVTVLFVLDFFSIYDCFFVQDS